MWINTAVNFPSHRAVLTLNRRSMYGRACLDMLKVQRESEAGPEQLEVFVRRVIEEARPELMGLTIYAMDFNARLHQWEFFVEHPSLPEAPLAHEPPYMPVFNDEEQQCSST